MRLGFLIVPVDVRDARIVRFERGDEGVAPFHDLLVRWAADDELDRLAAAASEALAHDGEGADAGQVGEFAIDLVDDIIGRAAITPVRQHGDDVALVIGIGAKARGAHEQAADFAGFRIRKEAALDLVEVFRHVFEGRAFRAAHRDEEAATVLARRVFLAKRLEQEPDGSEGGEQAGDQEDR